MKVMMVGCGKMGSAVEEVARARSHEVVARIDPHSRGADRVLESRHCRDAEVAFEFTKPDAAARNVEFLLRSGVRVVCGTTGWNPSPREIEEWARAGGVGAVVAPNFSVGVLLFARAVSRAAGLFAATGMFDPYVLDFHHRAKLDAPSGTAARLSNLLADAWNGTIVEGHTESPIPSGAVHVASVRAGHETGTHVVGFESQFDSISLIHRARGRDGFALGAVLAAEWVPDGPGHYGMDAVLDGLLSGAKQKGRET